MNGPRAGFPNETISRDQVSLRELLPEDAPTVAAAVDAEILRWLPLLPNPYRLEDAAFFCTEVAPATLRSGKGIVRAVEVDGQLAGVIDLKKADWRARTVEVGYWTAGWARGRGLTSATVDLLSRWALTEQGFRRVELRAAVGNVGSQRVAERAGFAREGVLRWAGLTADEPTDIVVFSRIRTDLGDALA
ncbi:GNAT family N-acetyltransferase [Microlunatus elymi]|uniref:GNAT family N-acetyltransferase n=1 Tax=Microlunatus elymi TaxID=2596828 RepID=UPI00143D5B2E|nr:GNAT family protein [Microlunatus elymi]